MRRGDVSAPDPWGPLIRHHQKSRSFRLGYEIFFHTNWLTLSSYISHLVLWRWLSLSLDRIVVVLVLFILVSSRRRRLYMCGSITSFIYTYVSVPLFFLFFCSLMFPISGICSPEENEPTPSAGSLIFCDVSVGTYSSHSHLSWYTFLFAFRKKNILMEKSQTTYHRHPHFSLLPHSFTSHSTSGKKWQAVPANDTKRFFNVIKKKAKMKRYIPLIIKDSIYSFPARPEDSSSIETQSAVRYSVNDVSDCLSMRIGEEFSLKGIARTETVETWV